MKVTKYKNCYIGEGCFRNKAEVDEYLKQQDIEQFKKLHRMFAEKPDIAMGIICDKQAERLHDMYGFEWDEIEQMEIEVYKEAAN